MNEKENKMKKWFKENKEDIAITALAVANVTVCTGFGYIIGKKITNRCNSVGMSNLHALGILKFFDPSTNTEIGVDKALEIAMAKVKK